MRAPLSWRPWRFIATSDELDLLAGLIRRGRRSLQWRRFAPAHAELDGNAESSSLACVGLPRDAATTFLATKARLADCLKVLLRQGVAGAAGLADLSAGPFRLANVGLFGSARAHGVIQTRLPSTILRSSLASSFCVVRPEAYDQQRRAQAKPLGHGKPVMEQTEPLRQGREVRMRGWKGS